MPLIINDRYTSAHELQRYTTCIIDSRWTCNAHRPASIVVSASPVVLFAVSRRSCSSWHLPLWFLVESIFHLYEQPMQALVFASYTTMLNALRWPGTDQPCHPRTDQLYHCQASDTTAIRHALHRLTMSEPRELLGLRCWHGIVHWFLRRVPLRMLVAPFTNPRFTSRASAFSIICQREHKRSHGIINGHSFFAIVAHRGLWLPLSCVRCL